MENSGIDAGAELPVGRVTRRSRAVQSARSALASGAVWPCEDLTARAACTLGRPGKPAHRVLYARVHGKGQDPSATPRPGQRIAFQSVGRRNNGGGLRVLDGELTEVVADHLRGMLRTPSMSREALGALLGS